MHGEPYQGYGQLREGQPERLPGEVATGQPPYVEQAGDYPGAASAEELATQERLNEEAEQDRLREQEERRQRQEDLDRLATQAQEATTSLTGSGPYMAMQEIINAPDAPVTESAQGPQGDEDPTARAQREQREQRTRDEEAARLVEQISHAEAVAREVAEQLQRTGGTLDGVDRRMDELGIGMDPNEKEVPFAGAQAARADEARVKADLARLYTVIEKLRARHAAL